MATDPTGYPFPKPPAPQPAAVPNTEQEPLEQPVEPEEEGEDGAV